MQTAELIGISEKELRGFLNSLPELWGAKTRFYESGIELMLNNYVDTVQILSSTHLFTVSRGFIALLTEYLKEVGAATFKIHAYIPWFTSYATHESVEKRFQEVISDFSEKDMSSFAESAFLHLFICPLCGAQYSFRVIRRTDDGRLECQNCGKLVSVKEEEPDSALDEGIINHRIP